MIAAADPETRDYLITSRDTQRHAGASLLDSANVPIGSIQRILGHENRTTTESYLHSEGDSERRAMEVFEAVCGSHTISHTEAERGQVDVT